MSTRFFKILTGLFVSTCVATPFYVNAQQAASPCDELVGDYALQPENRPVVRIEKKDQTFTMTLNDSGTLIHESFTPLSSADIAEMFEDQPMHPTCMLKENGFTIMKLPVGSPLNPTEDTHRDTLRYPLPTPVLMGVSVGYAAVMGLYSVPRQEVLKDVDEWDKDDRYEYSEEYGK
ncbi:hypothetical protein V2J87_10765 [Pseudomonas alliivorans]|nr:hypothetical protein [Pseudomonas alliivorans]